MFRTMRADSVGRRPFCLNPIKSGKCSGRRSNATKHRGQHGLNPIKSGKCSGRRPGCHPEDRCKSLNPIKSGKCSGPWESSRTGTKGYRLNPIKSGKCSGLFVKKFIILDESLNPIKSGKCSGPTPLFFIPKINGLQVGIPKIFRWSFFVRFWVKK